MTLWKFYIVEDGDTGDDAREVRGYTGPDEEAAVAWAAEEDWDGGGWELGVGRIQTFVLIGPDGETRWKVEAEVTVQHDIRPAPVPTKD